MYGWLLRRLLNVAFARLAQGDPRLVTALFADRPVFRFPGRSPWAADHRSKDDVARWLRRFAHFRPQFELHRVLASGPPWDIRGFMHFTDHIGDPGDPARYVNEGVCMFRVRWGRVVEERVFLDTQAVAEFFGTETPEEFFGDVPALR